MPELIPATLHPPIPCRGTAASAAGARRKVPCDRCGEVFHRNGLARHQSVCRGPETPKLPTGHLLCECGRLKAKQARCCFRCEALDDGMEWMKEAAHA